MNHATFKILLSSGLVLMITVGLIYLGPSEPTEKMQSRSSPKYLELLIDGPFTEEKEIQLEFPHSEFMEPRFFKIWKRDYRMVKAKISFKFKGPENPDTRINFRIDLLNDTGELIATRETACEDYRISARNPRQVGTEMLSTSAVNNHIFKIPAKFESIDQIRLSFNKQ